MKHFSFNYVILGKCEIDEGKYERNVFVYYPLSRQIHIDLDSDYSFTYQVNIKNPYKALKKARALIKKIPWKISTEELISYGFVFNRPF